MKIHFIILLLLLNVTGALCQNKTLSADSDTIFRWNAHESIKTRLGLAPINKIESDFYFRLWTGVNVLELQQKKGQLIGTVINLVQQYRPNKHGRIYYKKTSLTAQTTNEVYNLINKYKVLELPTDKQIAGWGGGFDGIVYIIETTNKSTYSFKNYWTPRLYSHKLEEARRLSDFIDGVNKIEELNSIHKRFMERQPFNAWYNFIGSASIVSQSR